MINFDAWEQDQAEKLKVMLVLHSAESRIVDAIYADQRSTPRRLSDFDFLLSEPDRSSWLHKAWRYAEANNLWREDLVSTLRAVKAHRKEKRKPK